ncbi:cysteine desulfurase [Panacagrimonas perspica]|uniref:Cysteine desulfurase n=1 Tax=Panacagrimonas perspica TaxID=381431 RepID=A0A4S3K1F2_9GAMM|nr:cysteine desulfurase family protein [Panacagrimonas perspica]TDU30741.1 cysteine desulfurase [Panacagrimonas perspica]THD01564.1 cysteine desulfurase [Panacagrimonas perspica]
MPTYLDHNATTHLDPRVLEAMLPYLSGPSANASSLHRYGRIARDAVEQARVQVAQLVGCEAKEVVWTSGGTEANNLALKGATASETASRVLYGATDHPAVMEAAESLAQAGWRVEAIAVDTNGVFDFAALEAQLADGPLRLVSAMRANNETGVIQDVARVAQLAHAKGALMHVDAVQAVGKIAVDILELDADLLSLSAHKIYGPKGSGALVVRSHVDLRPIQHGGAQERGLRGGTENVAAIVGFGAAAELARLELEERAAHVQVLRQRLEAGLRTRPDTLIFGGNAREHLPNTLQFAIAGWDGEALLMALDRKGFAVSSGSACASGSGEPSHVLLAMGHDRVTAKGAIRASFGKDNVPGDVDGFLAALSQIVASA